MLDVEGEGQAPGRHQADHQEAWCLIEKWMDHFDVASGWVRQHLPLDGLS
jgi:hypothetical protein